jgi:hypothetical protein
MLFQNIFSAFRRFFPTRKRLWPMMKKITPMPPDINIGSQSETKSSGRASWGVFG